MRSLARRLSFLAAVLALASAAPAMAQNYGPFQTSAGPVAVEKVAGPLAYPWSVAFLPQTAPWRGAMLVTERDGALRLIRDGKISAPISGVPSVRAQRQGGLLDVALSPDFSSDRRIYLTYSEPVGIFQSRTAVARGILSPSAQGARLERVEVIFRQDPPTASGVHYGARLVFANDGTLFVTLGERGDRERAQDLSTHFGKVIRINPDGSVPADNPFVGRADAKPEIWSYGHRNPQGAAKRPSDGALFTIAHGARGGDEVNRPEAGKNYGWPEISYGKHYSGFQIGRGASAPGMEQPLHYWDPSIAPSGAAFYTGDLFPQWKGDLLVGALKFALISRLEVSSDAVTESERLFEGAFGRIRDVRQGPDGAIWFLTDDDEGALYRAAPPGR